MIEQILSWLRDLGLSDMEAEHLGPREGAMGLFCRGSEVLLVGGVGAGDVPRAEKYDNGVLLCLQGEFPWHRDE